MNSLNRILLKNPVEAIVRTLLKVYDGFGSACGTPQSAGQFGVGGTERRNGGVWSFEEESAGACAQCDIRRSWGIVLAMSQEDTHINENPLRRKPAQRLLSHEGGFQTGG